MTTTSSAGQREGSPLSNMALLMMLRGMKRGDITAHGFRSTFSDWGQRGQLVQREAPRDGPGAHDPEQVERAYRRGDALEKRRGMMETWPNHCEVDSRGQLWQSGDESAAGN